MPSITALSTVLLLPSAEAKSRFRVARDARTMFCNMRSTVRTLMRDGKTAEAQDLLNRRGNEMMQAELSDVFKKNMEQLTKAERAIAASNLTPQEKRKQLDEIRKLKIGLANTTREISDKTIHLVGFS